MAKYTITHLCGHTQEVQLFGPSSERERKIAWLERLPCPACRRREEEEKRQAAAAEAASTNQAAGLPPLLGTEKQVAWAETIRAKTFGLFRKLSGEAPPDLKEFVVQTMEWLRSQTDSHWWIEKIGVLKSREGLAPLFGMLDGRQPPASDTEIIRALFLISPYLTQPLAAKLGLEREWQQATSARLQADAVAECEARKPKCPDFVFSDCPGGSWNGKIYGNRIFVGGRERKLSPNEKAELTQYLAAKDAWKKEMASLRA